MKIPEPPPQVTPEVVDSLMKKQQGAFFKPSAQLSAFIDEANAKYLHWEDFKYLKIPGELKPEEAWVLLKMHRWGNRQNTRISDNKGMPFHYSITPSLQSDLSQIDQSAASAFGLDETYRFNRNMDDRFIFSSLMEEGIASSVLEGAATTRPEAKRMLRENLKPADKSQKMILNNYRTILKIRDEWKTQKLSPDVILQIHRSMTSETLENPEQEGAFRTKKDDEEKLAVYDNDGTLLHQPPSFDKIQSLLEAFCQFANEDAQNEKFIHPVVKASLLHFGLAYIHPFADGNGRTARAIFYWYLLSRNYWLFEYLSISRIILNQKTQYLRAFLYTEHDDNDLNYFIYQQLRAILRAIADFKTYLGIKRREETASKEMLLKNPELNDRQRSILIYAQRNPGFIYTIKGHQNACNVVYQTARTDLLDLVKAGFMEMHKTGKKIVFIAK